MKIKSMHTNGRIVFFIPKEQHRRMKKISRKSRAARIDGRFRFPADFIWGVAASAPQIEGAWDKDRKGPSIWDTFCRIPGRVINGDTLDAGCDHYHRYEEDFRLMRELGIKNYRLSISWPRIIPDGDGAVNRKGVAFYHRVLDSMRENGIRPWVCFFHYDLPQSLEDRKSGWVSRAVPEAFSRFCGTVVKEYRDTVDRWLTINEPWCLKLGYHTGYHAPGRKENIQVLHQVLHHGMLAHGYAARAVLEFGGRGAQVGIVHNPAYSVPIMETEPHISAARQQFRIDTAPMMEPLIKGRYPKWWLDEEAMAAPRFDDRDMEIIGTPCDFFGLNVYTGRFVRAGIDGRPESLPLPRQYPRGDVPWLAVMPDAMYWAIRFTHEVYSPGAIHISENGCAFDDAISDKGEIIDTDRIDFLRNHLLRLGRALREGFPVKAYFLWSIFDNYEWADGYAKKFGIVGIERATMKRIPKASAHWYAAVMKQRRIV